MSGYSLAHITLFVACGKLVFVCIKYIFSLDLDGRCVYILHMTQREVIKALAKEGWVEMKKRGKGSHAMMKHPEKGKVTIPDHNPIKLGTLKSIERKTGVELRRRG